MKRVNLRDLREEQIRSPGGKFHSYFRNVSLALGGVRNVGSWGGGHPFDLQVRRIPAGAAVCPFHSHLAQWEFYLVRSGRGTVRTAAGLVEVGPGDCFIHPPGEAHQLANPGPTDLEVCIIADNPLLDGCHYPDSDKWALTRPPQIFRLTPADYLDGEEATPPGAPPFVPFKPKPPPEPAPFSSRLRNLDALAWESWSSPKGVFRDQSKEISVALGAKPNTPVGLGGHPFDVAITRISPGAKVCPFHWHAAQWEMYVVLDGTATLRTAEGTFSAGPGEVVLHPPFDPHQLANASSAEATVLIIADNPPVDYWHYPDSGKWGVREPRKFFRQAETEYFDGEE